MKHPVVWFEVMGEDGGALQRFYAELFGWKIDADNPAKYGMVEAEQGRGIPGGVGERDDPRTRVTFYVSTPDIEASLKRVSDLGGETLMPRTQLPGGTILGMFTDTAGNAVGLVEEGADGAS